MRTLHWFRQDLRITDNTALFHAANQADQGCLGIYFITPMTWVKHDMAPCQIDFILRGLRILQQNLALLNIPLLVLECNSVADIPALLKSTCVQYNINMVHFNAQYEIDETACDKSVAETLKSIGISVQAHHDQCIIAPMLIRTPKKIPYTVFSFFKKAWITYFQANPLTLFPKPKYQSRFITLDNPAVITDKIANFNSKINSVYWPAGEHEAKKRLDYFINNIIIHYHEWRDFPFLDGTSKLSPYLATGMISARECFFAGLKFNHGNIVNGDKGAAQWLSELIWREFYKMILFNFPRICKHRAFQINTDKLIWDNNPHFYEAWQKGKTGYPIVDAAMRQLKEIGWMHNRLRMVVAMFFSKQLWLDWRLGERYFMQNLIDGDLASNNGGWQWCASTGNDAAPYFRIFNPYLQSKRFDPDGKFIRQYCPELAKLDNQSIHQPYQKEDLFLAKIDYPAPIVDYKRTRERAILAFKQLQTNNTKAPALKKDH